MSQRLFRARRVLWMDPEGVPPSFATDESRHCCDEMRDGLVNACLEHAADPFACPDMALAYSDTFDEYGLIVHDGSASMLLITHCPFCGATLPDSRRDDWFDRLEAMGIDDPFAAELPQVYRSGAWRRATAN
jgi:hypothetical protein